MPLSDHFPEMRGWTPATNVNTTALPQLPTPEVQVSPFLRTTLPLPLIYTPDTLKQSNRPGLSSYRVAPQSPSSFPAINAGATSAVAAAIKQSIIPISAGGITSVGFIAPKEAVIGGSPVVPPGGVITWAWATELPNTVFAAGDGTAADEVDNSLITSNAIPTISLSVTPNQSSDLALIFTAQDNAAVSVFNPGAPWSTVISSGTDQSIYSRVTSGTGAVTATGATSVAHPSWVSALVLLTAKVGFTPGVVHQSSPITGTFGTQTGLSLGFTPTAGNTLILAIMGSNSNFFGAASVSGVTDSKGDTWVSLGTITNTSGAGEQLFLFATNNIAGGATTLNFTVGGTISGGGAYVVEVNNISVLNQISRFRLLTSPFIPPINLIQNGANGGVTGVLSVINGGTGVTTSTGTGSVVLSASPVFTGTVVLPIITLSGKIINYNGTGTVSNGVPAEYATIDLVLQAANIGATTLYSVPASGQGMYRISAYVVETTAGSVSSTLPNVQIVYTDPDTNTSITIDATPILGVAGIGQTGALTSNTVGTASSGVIAINVKASTTIQYQTVNYASTAAGMQYALHIKVEAM